MYVEFKNVRTGKRYEIERLTEYEVETTLDIPADYFRITIGNPVDEDGVGVNSNIIDRNDRFLIREDGDLLLTGIVDEVDESWTDEECNIAITGRDLALELLENDVLPETYKNIKLSSFINKLVSPFDLIPKVNSKHDKTIKEIVTEVGDNIWDAIYKEVEKLDLWVWCNAKGEITVDKLNYDSKAQYTFSNRLDKNDIRISSFSKKIKGADIINEVVIRGHDEKPFTHRYKDEKLTKEGFRRRRVLEDGDLKDKAEADKKSKKIIKDSQVGSFEIVISINGKHPVKIDEVAYLVDPRTDTNGHFFIVGVTDIKSAYEDVKKIRLRPLGEGLV